MNPLDGDALLARVLDRFPNWNVKVGRPTTGGRAAEKGSLTPAHQGPTRCDNTSA